MLTLNPTQYSLSPCVYNDTGPKNEKPPIRFLLLVGLCLICQQEKCIFLGPRFFRVFLTWDKWSSDRLCCTCNLNLEWGTWVMLWKKPW
jgi:hypothetical protein